MGLTTRARGLTPALRSGGRLPGLQRPGTGPDTGLDVDGLSDPGRAGAGLRDQVAGRDGSLPCWGRDEVPIRGESRLDGQRRLHALDDAQGPLGSLQPPTSSLAGVGGLLWGLR
jgi:hypothetical protein